MTEAELGWAAGIVDGEGNIYIGRTRHSGEKKFWRMSVQVTNTDPRIPAKMAELFGGNIQRRTREHNRYQTWVWEAQGQIGVRVLRAIGPYLVAKREQATIALRFMATFVRLHERKEVTPEIERQRLRLVDEMAVEHGSRRLA